MACFPEVTAAGCLWLRRVRTPELTTRGDRGICSINERMRIDRLKGALQLTAKLYDLHMQPISAFAFLAVLILPSDQTQDPDKKPLLDQSAAGPAGQIWDQQTSDIQEIWLRRSFKLTHGANTSRIVASCDNVCTIYLDGKRIASSNMWAQLIVADTGKLAAGDHLLAIHAKNTGGPAALALWLTWVDVKGESHELVSDASFRVSDESEEGWKEAKFDDSQWRAAREEGRTPYTRTVYGMEPSDYEVVSIFAETAKDLEQALEALRRAQDKKSAIRALDDLERAVMLARRRIHAQKDK